MGANNFQYHLKTLKVYVLTLVTMTCFFISPINAMERETPRAPYKSQSVVLPIQLFEEDNDLNRNNNNSNYSKNNNKTYRDPSKRDQQLLSTAIRIKCKFESSTNTATGFIGSFSQDNKVSNFLVTNKHVVSPKDDKLKKITFYLPFYILQTQTPSIQIYKVSLSEDLPFIKVLKNIDVKEDVSTIYLGRLIEAISNDKYYNNSYDSSKKMEPAFQIIKFNQQHASVVHGFSREHRAPIENLTLSSQVQMIGYPLGFYDTENNLPILRTGNMASDPIANHEGKGEYLINIPLYEGSSGSPVFMTKETQDSKKIFFIGMVYGGPRDKMSILLNRKLEKIEKRIETVATSLKSEISERKDHQEILQDRMTGMEEEIYKESSTDDDDSEDNATLKRKIKNKREFNAPNKRVKNNNNEAANGSILRQFANLAYVIKPQYIAECMSSVYNKLKDYNKLDEFPISYGSGDSSWSRYR